MNKQKQSPLEMIEGNLGQNNTLIIEPATKESYERAILTTLTDIKQELKDLPGRMFAWYIGTTILFAIIFAIMGVKLWVKKY